MGSAYPELVDKEDDIADIIKKVEEAYIKVRIERVPELKKLCEEQKDDTQRIGQLFFNYRDTFGLTLSTIIATAKDAGLSEVDIAKAEEQFHQLMEQQKEKSRATSKMSGDVFVDAELDPAVDEKRASLV